MIRGMARSSAAERARDRVLSDEELRAIWEACDALGTFGAVVRLLLLTGQRRGEVAGMRRKEIDGEDVGTIPAARYKTKRQHVVRLPRAARDIIVAQQVDSRGPDIVFPSTAGTVLTAWDNPKKALDKASGTTGWTLHDCRRTARTLMVRAGV